MLESFGSAVQYFNPHPKGKLVNDCVKRALTLATGKSYQEISLALNRYKKITNSKSFNSRKNVKEFIEKELGYKKLSFPAVAGMPRMNGYIFTKKYPKGKYILNMAKHLVTCVDGKLYDTFDSSDKCVYSAWVVKE